MRKDIRITEIINENFHEFWKVSKNHEYLKYVEKGGRGSAKSTHIGFRIIMDIMKYPISALVVRKVGNTLSESVYEQLKECAEILGVYQYFEFKVSPLQIIYRPRGNKIIFRGADDPMKIKSLKVAKYPVAILWVEELAEFKTEDEIQTIEQSVLRAELPEGLHYSFFLFLQSAQKKTVLGE